MVREYPSRMIRLHQRCPCKAKSIMRPSINPDFRKLKRASDSLSKNGHSIRPCPKPSQGGSALRRTRIGFPCSLKSIAQSPLTTSVSKRWYETDKPFVLTQEMTCESV